jgi:hypothetical protein
VTLLSYEYHLDVPAMTRQGFIDRIVYYFVDQLGKPAAGISDIHGGTLLTAPTLPIPGCFRRIVLLSRFPFAKSLIINNVNKCLDGIQKYE